MRGKKVFRMSRSADVAALEQEVSNIPAVFREHVVYLMHRVGEACVSEARSTLKANDWADRSGNLRSSIGYMVTVDGKVVTVSASGNPDGESAARRFLEKLRKEHTRGVALTVVAGMKYAVYVQYIYHKNVLISAELTGKRLAQELLKPILKSMDFL